MKPIKSPYLRNGWRLADVIAALQVMGSQTISSRLVSKWEEKLGQPVSAPSWDIIFREHPEFFRLTDTNYASLRWRHGLDRIYDPDQKRELSNQEIQALSEQQQDQLSRKPLDASQIESLMKTAVELHSRGIAFEQEKRWLTPLLFGLFGVIVGAVLQAALK
jgi:hypothetical protein